MYAYLKLQFFQLVRLFHPVLQFATVEYIFIPFICDLWMSITNHFLFHDLVKSILKAWRSSISIPFASSFDRFRFGLLVHLLPFQPSFKREMKIVALTHTNCPLAIWRPSKYMRMYVKYAATLFPFFQTSKICTYEKIWIKYYVKSMLWFK